MSESRVSRQIEKFNTFIINGNNRQLATNPVTGNLYYIDYGWTVAQSGSFTSNWHDKWVNDLYPKHNNPLTSTSTQKAKTHKHIEDFITWEQDNHLLDKIVSCGHANEDDEAIWNIDLERDEPTNLTSKIPGKPWASVEHGGVGTFKVKCRNSEDASRASIPREDGAAGVQYAFVVLDHAPTEEEVLDPNDKDVFTHEFSSKASFPFNAGAANRRKYIVLYFRWYNPSYPQFAGDWTEMIVMVIA